MSFANTANHDLAQYQLRPMQRSTTQEPSLPVELRDGDLAAWKIPNQIFCDEMERNLDRTFLILPWWHHYCQDFKEKKAKQHPWTDNYLPIHRTVLDKLQRFRRSRPKLGNVHSKSLMGNI
ncbi:jg6117 [Pararge aegeria aegeria]|uniref:Jg6117 protein n=1 Tax=Pararge aegeria aegeria TaxID=348720 RepID=A0A8S4RBG5_9NEOP|nr:jg6117 [Pararge aegeria aegeria]